MDSILISGLLLLAMVILAGVRLFRSFFFRPCPHCFHLVPPRWFNQQRVCPNCSGSLTMGSEPRFEPVEAEVLGEYSVERQPGPCARCRVVASAATNVRLWDGEVYCQACIDQVAPAVMRYLNHPELAEELRFEPWRIVRRTLPMALIACVVMDAAVLILRGVVMNDRGIPIAQRPTPWGLYGFLAVLNLMLLVLIGVIGPLISVILRPRTTVRLGVLKIAFPGWRLQARLRDCVWSEGRASQASAVSYGFALAGPALIVTLPRGNLLYEQGSRIAVGCSPESYELWKQFLTLAQIPRAKIEPSWWS